MLLRIAQAMMLLRIAQAARTTNENDLHARDV